GAAVTAGGVAVIALLAGVDGAVAAEVLVLAGRGAAVTAGGVAVVALLAGVDGAVAAQAHRTARRRRQRRHAVAALRLDRPAVRLARGQMGDRQARFRREGGAAEAERPSG